MRQGKKTDKARKESQKRAKEAAHETAIKQPREKTWSARMPAYAGTVLCADKSYWPMVKKDNNKPGD